MKTLVFFMYMFFLLLGGGQYFYASTSPSQNLKFYSSKFTQDKHSKLINEDLSTTLIEDTDVDVEEEYHSNEDFNTNLGNLFPLGRYSLLNTLYTSHSRQLLLNYYCTRFKISPVFFTSSSPIYITHRVLRI